MEKLKGIAALAAGAFIYDWQSEKPGILGGVGKFTGGLLGLYGLRELGLSENASIVGAVGGVAALEWYHGEGKSLRGLLPGGEHPALPPRTGWWGGQHGWGGGGWQHPHHHHHHDWDQGGGW